MFFEKVTLYHPGWPGTLVDLVGLELSERAESSHAVVAHAFNSIELKQIETKKQSLAMQPRLNLCVVQAVLKLMPLPMSAGIISMSHYAWFTSLIFIVVL